MPSERATIPTPAITAAATRQGRRYPAAPANAPPPIAPIIWPPPQATFDAPEA